MFLEDKLSALSKSSHVVKGERLLLLGDSIMLGYAPYLKKALSGAVEVLYPHENCRNSAYLLTEVNRLVSTYGSGATAVQVNCGHWDAAHFSGDALPLTSLSEYEKNMRLLLTRLRGLLPQAKLFVATTTPMNPDGIAGGNPRTTEEIMAYNRRLLTVCQAHVVEVLPLFDEVGSYSANLFEDYCHLTKEGFTRLADFLSAFYQKRLLEICNENG